MRTKLDFIWAPIQTVTKAFFIVLATEIVAAIALIALGVLHRPW